MPWLSARMARSCSRVLMVFGKSGRSPPERQSASCTPLTPSYKHRGAVYDLAVSPDDKTVAIACRGEPSIWLRPVPSPLSGHMNQIVAWAQVLAGMELEPNANVLRALDLESWEK